MYEAHLDPRSIVVTDASKRKKSKALLSNKSRDFTSEIQWSGLPKTDSEVKHARFIWRDDSARDWVDGGREGVLIKLIPALVTREGGGGGNFSARFTLQFRSDFLPHLAVSGGG